MSERMTRSELESAIERIQRVHGVKLMLDKDVAGYRIDKAGRYISPRLPMSAMRWWLEGFEIALHEQWCDTCGVLA